MLEGFADVCDVNCMGKKRQMLIEGPHIQFIREESPQVFIMIHFFLLQILLAPASTFLC